MFNLVIVLEKLPVYRINILLLGSCVERTSV